MLLRRISPGELDKRIAIQFATPTQGDTGEVTDSWSTYAERWAAMDIPSGKEFFAAETLISENTVLFRLYYTAGVTTKMRVSWDGRLFDIESAPADQRNNVLVLVCVERP